MGLTGYSLEANNQSASESSHRENSTHFLRICCIKERGAVSMLPPAHSRNYRPPPLRSSLAPIVAQRLAEGLQPGASLTLSPGLGNRNLGTGNLLFDRDVTICVQ